MLQPNEDFSRLPETYVIFITENDVIGKGKPIYRIERRILEIDEPFNDGEHILYVNGEDKNSVTELGRLMHDFFCTDPDDMHYPELANKVRYFKEDKKGVQSMCKMMEEMRNAVRIENARKMLADGLSIEKVAQYSGLPLKTVRELSNEKSA